MDNRASAPGARRVSGQHPYRLGRIFSLGRNKQFQYVYRRGKGTHGKYMTLVYLKARDLKVGFSVSAKVGKSVRRNRVRRMLREDFRMIRPQLPSGKYIFVARPGASQASHDQLTLDMRRLLSRAALLPKDPSIEVPKKEDVP